MDQRFQRAKCLTNHLHIKREKLKTYKASVQRAQRKKKINGTAILVTNCRDSNRKISSINTSSKATSQKHR